MRDDPALEGAGDLSRILLRLEEAEATIAAIRSDSVDAFVVESSDGDQIYTLERSDHIYRMLVEHMEQGAVTASPDGTILYANPRFDSMVGRSGQGTVGASLYDFAPAEWRGVIDAVLRRGLLERMHAEATLNGVDGNPFPVHLAASALHIRHAELVCVMVTDLSSQRRYEEALRAERLASSILEQAVDALAVCDTEGRIVRASRGVHELCGTNPLLRPFAEVFPLVVDGERGEVGFSLARVLAGASVRDLAARYVNPAGQGFDLILNAGPLRAPADASLGCVVGMTDVTRWRAAEDARRESDKLLRALLDCTTAIIYVTDREHRFLMVNREFEKVFGLSGERVRGRSFEEVLAPSLASTLHAHSERVFESGREMTFEEVVPQAGSTATYLAVTVPLRGEDGAIRGLCTVATDVTERKQLEHELSDANRRKDEFLALLAHELRNPLGALTHAMQLLLRTELDTGAHAAAVQVADRQLHQLRRLVDDLLDVSRISRGKIDLRLETLDLRDVIRAALETVRALVDQNRHEVSTSLPEQPVPVHGDAARLEQVFANLLNNAARYTGSGGRIEVSLRLEDGTAVVRVADTGVGIDAAMLPRIFDLFIQADSSLARSQGGLGIGLSLVRALVTLHGGSVSVSSRGLGQGSEFQVRLPTTTRTPQRKAEAPAMPAVGRSRRVLVVDDDADSRAMLRLLLESMGHTVLEAGDCESALASTAAGKPEVILLDLGLPGTDGYETSRRLRRSGCTARIIALTGYGDADSRQRTEESGFDAHLVKPCAPRDLTIAICSGVRHEVDST